MGPLTGWALLSTPGAVEDLQQVAPESKDTCAREPGARGSLSCTTSVASSKMCFSHALQPMVLQAGSDIGEGESATLLAKRMNFPQWQGSNSVRL